MRGPRDYAQAMRSPTTDAAGPGPGGDATVMVVGLGDLGCRVLDRLAYHRGIGRLVGASRAAEAGRAIVNSASLVARVAGGPREVAHVHLDLDEPEGVRDALRALDPIIIVAAASAHTWWRTPDDDPALRALPYAAWLPLLIGPMRALMDARDAAGSGATVVCLPYPDLVGPVLAGLGRAPAVGAGNVAEVAAKLQVCVAASQRVAPRDVDVRLVAHHAVEREALTAFGSVAGTAEAEVERGSLPWHADVKIAGRRVADDVVTAAFSAPYALLPGRSTQDITAASAVATVDALLGEEPVAMHAPAPGGRPGGYPVLISRDGIVLDLPPGLSEDRAVALNEHAARWDGVEAVHPDGSVQLTAPAAEALRRAVGPHDGLIRPCDHDGLAAALRERRR